MLYILTHVLSAWRCTVGQYVPFDESELQFLNNFLGHFAIGNDPHPSHSPDGFSRTNFHSLGLWNESYRDSLVNLGLSESQIRDGYSDRSDKRLNQTHEQFYAEIDRTTQELGMDLALVQRTINIYLYESRRKDCVVPRELSRSLDQFLAPIYKALRLKGYNKSDLWC